MIHVSSPELLGNEKRYVNDCLDKGLLSWRGEYVSRFERAFADLCEVDYAVACSSGTAALHLAMLAMDVKPGDDVFMPALTYVATANAARYMGANPVFCDVDPRTWTLDPADVEAKIKASRNPAVILPVHLYGVPADMSPLSDLADKYGLMVLEDAAGSHGSFYDGSRTGSMGDIGIFSFFANKLLTTGEGGMVTTNDPTFAELCRLYRAQAQPEGKQFWHVAVGYNYRMTNLQAAIGLAQVENQHEHFARHQRVVDWYARTLKGSNLTLQEFPRCASPNQWLFTVLLPAGVNRDKVGCAMHKAGVETRPIFPPLTWMPPYEQETPLVTADLATRGISLPTHAGLTDDDLELVVSALDKAVHES